MILLPQKQPVGTDLQPFKQETDPLSTIWCVKMEDDAHQPDELNSHLRFMKAYLKARYRLSDLLSAQRNEHMPSNLKSGSKMGYQTKENWKRIVTESRNKLICRKRDISEQRLDC